MFLFLVPRLGRDCDCHRCLGKTRQVSKPSRPLIRERRFNTYLLFRYRLLYLFNLFIFITACISYKTCHFELS